MRILIPVVGFGNSGGYRVLSELANAWIRREHSVAFLCPDSGDEPYFSTKAEINWVNGDGIVSTTRAARPRPSGYYHLKALYHGLRSIGRQYDVILANHSFTAWPVALAPCGSAKKIYYVQAYEPEFYTSSPSIRNYARATLSAVSYQLPLDRIVNSTVYFHYKNLRASKFVAPGIDLSIFRPSGKTSDLENADTIRIGCIGRREPEKGTIYVLRAFEELYKQDSRYLLRVAYGNLPRNWKHPRCEIVIPKGDHGLAEFYRNLDILVAAGTVQHGAPHYPVLEAWACGVPVVTTGYMGATEKTAWLVGNKDAMSIYSAISKLVTDRLGRQQRLAEGYFKAQSYSWDRVGGQMLALFAGSSS